MHTHRLRTYDGYFPNSLVPISYLEYIQVRSDKQSCLQKKYLNDGNHGQETHVSAKMGADSLAENTLNTTKFIQPICSIGPNVWNIRKKA